MARVYARIDDNGTFWDVVSKIYNSVHLARGVAEKGPQNGFTPDPKEVYKYMQMLNRVEEWFNQTVKEARETPLWQPLPVKVKVARDKLYELEHDVEFFQNHVQAGPKIYRRGAISEEEGKRMEKMYKYQMEKERLGKQSKAGEEDKGASRTAQKSDPGIDGL
jgi:hypothetical protein